MADTDFPIIIPRAPKDLQFAPLSARDGVTVTAMRDAIQMDGQAYLRHHSDEEVFALWAWWTTEHGSPSSVIEPQQFLVAVADLIDDEMFEEIWEYGIDDDSDPFDSDDAMDPTDEEDEEFDSSGWQVGQ